VQAAHCFEEEARERGHQIVAGLDEAGRGPLAGPVVAAAVVLPRRFTLEGLDDSKRVSKPERERLAKIIACRAHGIGVGMASAQEIDRFNILGATRLAMIRALEALTLSPDFLLLDAMILPTLRLPQRPVIKGDCLSVSIAAASIMAKVARDRMMHEYHQLYPRYCFNLHKGYATPKHLRLLAKYGPCEIHRRSFRPVAVESNDEQDDRIVEENLL
jgi:ribonuclease HII